MSGNCCQFGVVVAHNLKLSILMPACNEEGGLAASVGSVLRQIDTLQIDAELLIVDDGSRDRTGRLAEKLATQEPRIRVFRHPSTLGIGGGFLTGVREARGEFLILIPADLAMDLDDLPKYLAVSKQADIVVGLCRRYSDYTLFRRIVHDTNIRLIRLLFGMRLRQFQYICLYRLDVLREMRIEYWHSAFFHAEVLIKATAMGRRLVEVEITGAPRAAGRATGARWALILRTVRDMFRFWSHWIQPNRGRLLRPL